MRSACGKFLQTQTLKPNVGLWDLRAYLNLAKISDSVNMNSHGPRVCSLCITSANTMVYNWLKGEIHLATPTSFCSLDDFPSEHLAGLFLSCEEVTALCWPWFPLPNRCWSYFILQMRHFVNYHESKELLELRGREWNGKKGKEGKEWLCRQILHTIESLLAQKKTLNIRKVTLRFSAVALSFFFSFATSKYLQVCCPPWSQLLENEVYISKTVYSITLCIRPGEIFVGWKGKKEFK